MILKKLAKYINVKKIRKALVEGQLLRRSRETFWKLLGKAFIRLEEEIDFAIGRLVRQGFVKKIPVQENLVVFCSFQGDYTDNPKYICDELIRQKVDCEIIWIGRKKSAEYAELLFPKEISAVYEWWTVDAYRALAKAKVLVINSVELFKRPVVKKPGQYIIETWHGSLGIKRFDREHNSGRAWVKAADYVAKITDYLLSNSTFENEIYRNSFWPDTEILEYGHPRNDCIINCTPKQRQELRHRFFSFVGREDRGEKILLYAPTFRDEKNFDCYNLNPETLITALKRRFGGEWVAAYRYHPTVRALVKKKNAEFFRMFTEVIDATDYPDMQDLLQIADVGITDYSSWIFDFALTPRPAFIFATDIKHYNNERGFAYPLEQTPFPLASSNAKMEKNILTFDSEKYEEGRQAFLKGKGCFEDGHACERTVEKIRELIGNK